MMVTIIVSCSARFLTSRDYQHWAESTWQAAEEPNHHAGESVDVRDATVYRFSLIWFLVREWFYRHMVFGSPHVLFFEAFPPVHHSWCKVTHQHAMQLRSQACGHFGWSSAADRLGTDTLPNPTLPFVCCVYISKWYNIIYTVILDIHIVLLLVWKGRTKTQKPMAVFEACWRLITSQ